MIIKIFLTSFVMWLLLFGFTVLLAVSDEEVDPLKREDYKKIIDKLKDSDFSIYALDSRGHGRSEGKWFWGPDRLRTGCDQSTHPPDRSGHSGRNFAGIAGNHFYRQNPPA